MILALLAHKNNGDGNGDIHFLKAVTASEVEAVETERMKGVEKEGKVVVDNWKDGRGKYDQ